MTAYNGDDSGTGQGVQTDGTLIIAVRPGGQPNAQWVGYTGWTKTRVTTGIETFPADFELEATDKNPDQASELDIQAGYECFITIGGVTVLTGNIDRVSVMLSPKSHTLRIEGRSKCADLVDCSASFSTFQINNTNPLALATALAAPFGVTVTAINVPQVAIPQFSVILTETPYEIIERVARFGAMLAYDGPDGNLILARAGSGSMASGFTQGKNCQELYGMFTMDERYSSVEIVINSVDTLFTDPSEPESIAALPDNMVQGGIAFDLGVPRYRPLILVAEQGDIHYEIAQQRCLWEAARRGGRSQAVRIICDSWFDSAGALWTKNMLAPIVAPSLKLKNVSWLIGSVSFIRDESGTRAEVELMPPAAFLPEPIILQPLNSGLAQALNTSTGAAADGTDGTAPTPETTQGVGTSFSRATGAQ